MGKCTCIPASNYRCKVHHEHVDGGASGHRATSAVNYNVVSSSVDGRQSLSSRRHDSSVATQSNFERFHGAVRSAARQRGSHARRRRLVMALREIAAFIARTQSI